MKNSKSVYQAVANKMTGNAFKRLVGLETATEALRKDVKKLSDVQDRMGRYDTVGIMPISEREIAVKLFNDLIMYLDPYDIAVVPHIALERIWEREITYAWLATLEKDVRPDPVVVDIGANFGYYSVFAAQMNRKRGKVILFEANPNLHHYIHKTLSVNWLNENTIVENTALSNKKGTSKLNIFKDYIGSSSMQSIERLMSYNGHQMNVEAESTVTVPTIDLDSYCKMNKIKKIDLIKMDIEGYEETAYEGMRRIVKESPNLILFMEFTKGGYENPQKFYAQLISDFEFVYSIMPDGQLRHLENTEYGQVISTTESLTFLVFSKHKLSHVHIEEEI